MLLEKLCSRLRSAARALAAAVLLVAVAVAPAHAQKKTVTVTDVAGRQVQLQLPVGKAIIAWSGSGGPFMTMSALLGKDVHKHIAGWDGGLEKYRKDMYDAYLKTVPELKNIPVLGSPDSDDFNIEKAIALAPDVAIFPLGLQKSVTAGIAKKLEEAGIPVVFTDYHAETVENHRKTTLLLGQLFNKESRAKELADLYTSKRREVEARVAKARAAGRKAPRVYIEVGSKGPGGFGNSYSSKFMWGGMTTIAGGNVVTGSTIVDAAPASPEFVLRSNPEVIVLTGSYWPKTPESLLMGYTATQAVVQAKLGEFAQRPGWGDLDAIKNKRLYAVHHGAGRELFDYITLIALGKFLYPEEFKDMNPEAELKAYYQKYLPYQVGGIWFYQWK